MWLAGIRSLRYQGSCWARQGVPTTAAEHRVPSYLGQGRFFWRLSGRNCGSRIVADIHGGAAGCSNGCRFGTLPCRSQSRPVDQESAMKQSVTKSTHRPRPGRRLRSCLHLPCLSAEFAEDTSISAPLKPIRNKAMEHNSIQSSLRCRPHRRFRLTGFKCVTSDNSCLSLPASSALIHSVEQPLD
ncbi:hypothetical protein KL929_004807 [Ogataea haglerorum]|nr:hypothetical protein KL929_004807 [Ogataea haglerorum]